MLRLGTFEGRGFGTAAFCLFSVAAAFVAPSAALSHVLLVSAFGAAILNIIVSEQTSGAPNAADLALLFVSGFAASAFGTEAVSSEFLQAILRMALLGSAVWGLAWAYQRLRGVQALGVPDILLMAILGAFLPFAVAVYAVAFAIALAVLAIVIVQFARGEKFAFQVQVPIASAMSVFYFAVWVAYGLRSAG